MDWFSLSVTSYLCKVLLAQHICAYLFLLLQQSLQFYQIFTAGEGLQDKFGQSTSTIR